MRAAENAARTRPPSLLPDREDPAVDTIEHHADAPVRIATETIEHDIDGVNTVIAQEGQPVPRAFAHLVPDEATVAESDPAYINSRSTTARRRAHAERAAAQTTAGGEERRGRRRRGAKAAASEDADAAAQTSDPADENETDGE